jgi:hypothetical protein
MIGEVGGHTEMGLCPRELIKVHMATKVVSAGVSGLQTEKQPP